MSLKKSMSVSRATAELYDVFTGALMNLGVVLASLIGCGLVAVSPGVALAQARPASGGPTRGTQPGPVWPELSAVERDQVMAFSEDFKRFIGGAKSALTFVRDATKIIEAAGFKPWPDAPSKADVKPGSRWYAVNRSRTIVAFVIGREPLSRGARIP